MKKVLLIAALLCCFSANAQTFKFGTATADVGVGFGLYRVVAYSPINNMEHSALGGVGTLPSIDAEFGLMRFLGIGVHYRRGGYGKYSGAGKIRGTDFCGMVNFHVANKRDKFDLVIGAGYGLSNFHTPSGPTEQLEAKGTMFRIHVTPKIYFHKYVGMFIRVAYNKHFLNNNVRLVDGSGRIWTETDGATWNMGGLEFNIGVAGKFDIFSKKEEKPEAK